MRSQTSGRENMNKYVVAVITGVLIAVVVTAGLWQLVHHLTVKTGEPFDFIIFWWIGPFLGAMVAFVMAMLAGNRRSVTAKAGDKAGALAMAPPPGKALVYVIRRGFVGWATGLNIVVDGQNLVQLKSPRFSILTVSPGRHLMEAAMGGLAGPQNRSTGVELALEAGEVQAYEFGIAMGALQNALKVSRRELPEARGVMAGLKMTVAEAAA
jgi:hypothetical protein